MKSFHIFIVVLIIAGFNNSILFAQQWVGSDTTINLIWREGNVGIGTDLTDNKLMVDGGNSSGVAGFYSNDNSYIRIASNRDNQTLEESGFYLMDNNSNVFSFYKTASNEFNIYDYRLSNSAFNIDTNGDIYFDSDNTLHIDHGTGNVGIGTANPGSDLEISDNSGSEVSLIFNEGGTDRWTIGIDTSPDNYFTISSSGNLGSEKFVVNPSNGYVGIGTTSPQSKLAVNGTITSKEIVVTDSGWSDFVFEPDYPLISLEDVAQYIKETKHLPGIPSAEEVKENGVAVGEMQSKLLQKIEELTLYTLGLHEQNKKQQETIEELRKEIDLLKN
jgi:hypothetical protein